MNRGSSAPRNQLQLTASVEVVIGHAVSEKVRAYLNTRELVHVKRTCKAATAEVAWPEITVALLYDTE